MSIKKEYTKEECVGLAEDLRNRNEFRKKYRSQYNYCERQGWLDDIFPCKKKYNFWTFERCKEEGLKYRGRKEFCRKNRGAYDACVRNGWLDAIFGKLSVVYSNKKKWTYDVCVLESKKYTTRTQYKEGSPNSYRVSLHNGWLEGFDWLRSVYKENGELKNDCVYIYRFSNGAVYIGRTIDREKRDIQHRQLGDVVYDYAFSQGYEVPIMEIVYDKITLQEGVEKEKELISEYKDKGVELLNKNGGGSVGGISKWTYSVCFKLASKSSTLLDFKLKYKSAYIKSRSKGWLKDYDWFLPYSYEECVEKSKKYDRLSKFRSNCRVMYEFCKDNDWLRDFVWLSHQGYTYDECKQIALRYSTKKEFLRCDKKVYKYALSKGWLKKFVWVKKSIKESGYWHSFDNCKRVAELCVSATEFRKKYGSAYNVALKKGWMEKLFCRY